MYKKIYGIKDWEKLDHETKWDRSTYVRRENGEVYDCLSFSALEIEREVEGDERDAIARGEIG